MQLAGDILQCGKAVSFFPFIKLGWAMASFLCAQTSCFLLIIKDIGVLTSDQVFKGFSFL